MSALVRWTALAALLILTLMSGVSEARALTSMFAITQSADRQQLPPSQARWHQQSEQHVATLITETNNVNAGLIFDLGDRSSGQDVNSIAFSYHRNERGKVYLATTHPCLRIESIDDKGHNQFHTIYVPQMHNYNAGNGWRNCVIDVSGNPFKRVTRVALVVARTDGLVAPDFADCTFANFTVNGKAADSISLDVDKEIAHGETILQYPNLRYAKP